MYSSTMSDGWEDGISAVSEREVSLHPLGVICEPRMIPLANQMYVEVWGTIRILLLRRRNYLFLPTRHGINLAKAAKHIFI